MKEYLKTKDSRYWEAFTAGTVYGQMGSNAARIELVVHKDSDTESYALMAQQFNYLYHATDKDGHVKLIFIKRKT